MRTSHVVFGLVGLVALTACQQKPSQKLVSIQVTPPTVKLEKAGVTQALVAIGLDTKNNQLPLTAPQWQSSNEHVVTVDSTGKITATRSGTAVITVTQDLVKGAAMVTIAIRGAIKVEPASVKITQAGDKPKFVATVLSDSGEPIAGPSVTFSVADTNVATVDDAGVVTGHKNGSTLVTAASGSLKSEVKVDVSGLVEENSGIAKKAKAK